MNRTNPLPLLTGLCLLALCPVTNAGDECQPFTAVGATVGTSPVTFAGSATTTLGEAEVHVTLLGAKPAADALNAVTSHVMIVGGLTLTTEDAAMLKPTTIPGLYELNTQAKIVAGGGGHLSIDGLVYLGPGAWAKWLARGVVCTP